MPIGRVVGLRWFFQSLLFMKAGQAGVLFTNSLEEIAARYPGIKNAEPLQCPPGSKRWRLW